MSYGRGRKTAKASFLPTPLCPAGHLPRKGGDQMSPRLSLISNAVGWAVRPKLLISPLAGEMPGRAEGGVPERSLRRSGSAWLA
ncbi:hypothetical protein EN858_16780 [Mesorhizobium sp. M4B.F.Ca.ET.215.01.1.1]|nr:hypothetical protein EOA34_01125 [Mesorhizobium sp. M4B.F.Ca.ET.013.02.1.1]RVD33535.1 hypothetical protein EN741_31885 [Mesorhizobium sp. M4B.F.Ca.ET.019.03.1.1]RWF64538.1 MAG: hypothetical protein EOS47_14425 [Mesorhizobium sp.]TGQ10811.1 hypothetical protein EN858_16780 [Mesorhizobium sp. M4B.F.Ca.ET.215.01.1.1]TGQ36391.1 hypothetical protein EN857_17925 [Mesorhizobium sp. M4B.F.Ca.ET.214.01.1.1]TGQ38316.1 hypothetical protein EN863_026950 [Mesorhizobium sp. M00.F.Ca.ET.220.01.1.1]TGQ591